MFLVDIKSEEMISQDFGAARLRIKRNVPTSEANIEVIAMRTHCPKLLCAKSIFFS